MILNRSEYRGCIVAKVAFGQAAMQFAWWPGDAEVEGGWDLDAISLAAGEWEEVRDDREGVIPVPPGELRDSLLAALEKAPALVQWARARKAEHDVQVARRQELVRHPERAVQDLSRGAPR